MATVIDALLVTLSLDAAGMKEGAHDASAAYDKMVEDAKKASREFQAQMDADAAAFKRKQKAEEQAYKESQETVKVSAKERAKGLANFKNEQSVESEIFRKSQREKSLAFKDAQELQIKKSKDQQGEVKKSADGMSYLNGKILGVIAAFVGLDALKNFTERLVDSDTHVKRVSGALGLASEQLNAWQMAAEKSGASAEDIESAFRSVNKFQEDIAKGNPAAIAKLTEFAQTIQGLNSIRPGNKQIVFDVQKLTDKSLPAEERMLEISKILSQLSEKDAALAAEKLGISEDVSRFLRQGSDEVQKSVDSAKELDPAFKKAADDSLILSRQWTDIKQEIKGASDSLLVDMFPAIKAVGDIIKGFAGDWRAIFSGKGGEKLKGPANIQYDAMGNATGVSLDDEDAATQSPAVRRNAAGRLVDENGKTLSDLDKESSTAAQPSNTLSQAFDPVKAAQDDQTKYGIPAAVTLAQYQLESGSGKRMPAASNNPFGIKAKPGQPYVEAETTEVVGGVEKRVMQKFAKFDSIADAFDAHTKLLATAPAYAEARKHEGNASDFADALTGKYATDPNYGSKIRQLIAPGSAIDKSLMTGASAAVAANQTTNNNQSSNANSVETNINGPIHINAPNAKTNGDVADAIGDRLGSYAFASNANLGQN